MFKIQDFIKEIQSAKVPSNITINVYQTAEPRPIQDDDGTISVTDLLDEIFAEPVEATPPTDFEEGDRVMVCHIKKDGTSKHTDGTVTTVLGCDEDGWFTRVTGDNGCHYKTGLMLDEERKGSKIIRKL